MVPRWKVLAGLAVASLLVACGGGDGDAEAQATQPTGIYGASQNGTDADVIFAEAGVQAHINCSTFESTGPWQVDQEGKLLLKGRLRDGSLPSLGGSRGDSDQATLSGQLNGEQFTFSVSYPERASPIGPYTVVKGGPRSTVVC